MPNADISELLRQIEEVVDEAKRNVDTAAANAAGLTLANIIIQGAYSAAAAGHKPACAAGNYMHQLGVQYAETYRLLASKYKTFPERCRAHVEYAGHAWESCYPDFIQGVNS